MKVLRNIFITLILLTISNLVFSAGGGSGKVIGVRVDASGFGIVSFSNFLTTPAPCVIPYYNNAMSFNTNTTGGKAMLATILFAQSKNSNIYSAGTGACAIYGASVEDMIMFIETN